MDTKKTGVKLGIFEMCWRRTDKTKWSDKVTNEEVVDLIVEKKTLLQSILRI